VCRILPFSVGEGGPVNVFNARVLLLAGLLFSGVSCSFAGFCGQARVAQGCALCLVNSVATGAFARGPRECWT